MKSPEELLKAGQEAENEVDCRFGSFQLRRGERTLRGLSGPVPLTPKEFEMLSFLAKNVGRPVSGETLLRHVWQDTSVAANNVPQVIARLRRKLGKNEAGQDYILTLPNVGYVLSATAETAASAAQLQKKVPDSHDSEAIIELPANPVRNLVSVPRRLLYATILVLIVLLVFTYFNFRGRSSAVLVTSMNRLTGDGLPKRGPLLSDGTRIWFQEEVDGAWRVVSIAVAGGDVTPLEVPLKHVQLEDVAADGSALLLSAAGGDSRTLWSWPLSGGAPQMLQPPRGEAAWAPDKNSIAFGTIDTLILPLGTASPSSTAIASGTIIHVPRWSPDGEQITFQLLDRKTPVGHLWLSDRRGAHVHPVPGAMATSEDQVGGMWTRDGRYYVFASGSTKRHDLWGMRSPDRGLLGSYFAKPARITNGPFDWNWPTPSRASDEIYAMGESIQGKLTRLVRPASLWHPYLGGIPAYELDFSRDGRWVVYVHYPDHTLWKSRVDGYQRVQLTSSAEFEAHQPHWSPDGTRIAFMGQRPGSRWRAMILNSGGKIEEPLPATEDQGVPTWSPDGLHLLYGDWPFGKDSRLMRLHILDLSTHRAAPMEAPASLWTPRWSPDGGYISALRENSTGLMLTRAGKPSWNEIMIGDALDDTTWSSDSRQIYVTVQHRQQLRVVNVQTGRIEQVADIHDFPITDEPWFGVAPDGSPLALQAFPEQEIYSLHWVLP